MADELEVKEITELNDVSFTDESLVLAYTENDGIGKATFANAKSAIGADISIEQTKTGTTPSAVNELTATVRNGGTTETKKFVIRNGTGLSQAAQTESTDANGLRSNSVSLKSSDTTLVDDISFTVKDGVGIKSAEQTLKSDDDNGTNEFSITLTDGQTKKISVKNGKTGTGATVATAGMYGFYIDSGNLVLSYSGDTAPSLALNSSGELIYSL